jgi:hypothetical protein
LCDDKVTLNSFLIERGYGRLIPAMGPGLEPPFMLKKRIDAYARNCHRIASGAEFQRFESELASGEYFTQQLIPGYDEFATHIVFEAGRIVAHLCVRYVYSTDAPIKGRDRARYTQLTKCRHLDLWAELLALVQYEGLCCINYKVLAGRPMLLEINPRFGGSLAPYFFSFLRHLKPVTLARPDAMPLQDRTAAPC